MTIYDLKPAFQSLLRALVRALAGRASRESRHPARAVLSVALGIALALNPDQSVLWASCPRFCSCAWR